MCVRIRASHYSNPTPLLQGNYREALPSTAVTMWQCSPFRLTIRTTTLSSVRIITSSQSLLSGQDLQHRSGPTSDFVIPPTVLLMAATLYYQSRNTVADIIPHARLCPAKPSSPLARRDSAAVGVAPHLDAPTADDHLLNDQPPLSNADDH